MAVRTAMEYPTGALPRTPFPAARDFPSRGNERYEGENSESCTSRTISAFPPLVAAPPPFPRKRGHNKAPRFHLFISGSTISTGCSSPARGGSPAQRERGGERSEPITRMLIMLYSTESQSRNADFISIAPKGETTHYILRVASAPSKCVRCAPRSGNPPPSAAEPLSPPERSDATLLHNPRRSRAPFLQNLRRQPPPPPSEPCEPSEPFEPGPRSGPIEALFSPARKHRDI